MSITEDYNLPAASTLDPKVLLSIRQAFASFYDGVGLKYTDVKLDESLYNECCQEAINRGFPMDGNFSIRPYMAIGVATFCHCYTYLPDRATKMWICLYTALHICTDDRVNRGQGTVDLYRFHERFMNCQPQGDPGLGALDALLRETPHHYPPLVSNLIITSSLDFVSALLIEVDTKDMQISTSAPYYPEYSRLLSGIGSAFSLFIFPATIPYRHYIQCMPDLMYVVNGVNDIFSFYKEESAGEAINYVSLVAATRGLTKLEALQELVKKTTQAHHNILECLRPHTEAYDSYVAFFDGCIKLYAALRRYKLEEIMVEEPSCQDS